MNTPRPSCLCLSSFNLDTFAGYLANAPGGPDLAVTSAPFGQVLPVLADETAEVWRPRPRCTLVWTQPQDVIEAFGRLLDQGTVEPALLDEQVDAFAALLGRAASRTDALFVPTWTLPVHDRGLGPLDLRWGMGRGAALLQMNARLSRATSEIRNLYLLNAQRWIDLAGPRAFNAKLWYMAKVPFGNAVLKAAVEDVRAALAGLAGRARKLVVVDLDDTLWGGIVGDVGWENLVLGGHDPAGEAYVDFQRALKRLTRRGILLGIVSKNEETVALEALRRHPEMVLRPEDFAGWRIDWQDKARNLAELVAELNLGIDAVVFVDDNPVERARVRETLSDVLVPDWPDDPMLYPAALAGLTCFDAPALSREDLARAEMYLTERRRSTLRSEVGSIDEWLKTLEIRVTVEPLAPANLPRTAQLLNKTNQMNLSTRRLTEPELAAWAAGDGRRLWTFRVADKFGDSGLTGIASLEREDAATGRVVDFILSCRVMGRKIEETMLATVLAHARDAGLETVVATYRPTPKNKPCFDFWKRSGFAFDQASSTFRWSVADGYPFPAQVSVEPAAG